MQPPRDNGAGLAAAALVALALLVAPGPGRAQSTPRPAEGTPAEAGGEEPSLFAVERRGYATRFGRGKLLHLLSTGSAEERSRAAAELGRRGDAAAVPALLGELGSPSSGVRQAVIEALGTIGDRRAVPALLGQLETPGREQAAAVRALGLIGDERALDPVAALIGQPALSDEVVEAMLALGPRALQRGVGLLGDPATAGPACTLLGRLGDRRAVYPMIRALSSTTLRVRAECAAALGELGDPRASRALASLLEGSPEPVRLQALSSLARLADGTSAGVLVRALEARVEVPVLRAVRGPEARAGVEALGRIGSAAPSPAQAEAVAALGRIGGEEAASALGAMLASERGELRFEAAAALAAAADPAARLVLLGAAAGEGPGRTDALRGLGETFRSTPLLAREAPPGRLRALTCRLLADERAELAGAAAYLAGATRDRRAVDALAALLASQEPALRGQAVASLGWIGGPRACSAVTSALSDPDEGVRAAAAWAAGEASCREARSALLAMAAQGSAPRSAVNVAFALGALGVRQAVPALRRHLEEGGPGLRANAALALASLGDRGSLRSIRDRLRAEGSPAVRVAMIEALGRLPDPRSASLLGRFAPLPGRVGRAASDALRAVETVRPRAPTRGVSVYRARLVGASGEPLTGVLALLALPDGRMMTAMTDVSGEIAVPGLPEGEVAIGVGRAPEL